MREDNRTSYWTAERELLSTQIYAGNARKAEINERFLRRMQVTPKRTKKFASSRVMASYSNAC